MGAWKPSVVKTTSMESLSPCHTQDSCCRHPVAGRGRGGALGGLLIHSHFKIQADNIQPTRDPELEGQARLQPDSRPRETSILNDGYFKALSEGRFVKQQILIPGSGALP